MAQQTILEEGAFTRTQRDQINENFTELYGAVTDGTSSISTVNVAASGYVSSSAANALTAAGTDRATALQLAAQVNNITTAAASTGVILPTVAIGTRITLANNGANTVQVYAAGSQAINGTAGATGITLAATKFAEYWYVATNVWISVTIN